MRLEEAREKAALLRDDANGIYLVDVRGLITALDDRITELEAQRDEFKTHITKYRDKLEELGALDDFDRLIAEIEASDKEDKG